MLPDDRRRKSLPRRYVPDQYPNLLHAHGPCGQQLPGRKERVQIAVLQALGLVGFPAAVDLEGQLVVAALAQHVDGGGQYFDVAGGLLGVLAVTLPDNAGDLQGGLLVQVLDDRHHFLGLDDQLGGAVEVTQHDEGQAAAHLTDIFHEAGQSDGLTHVLHAHPSVLTKLNVPLQNITNRLLIK